MYFLMLSIATGLFGSISSLCFSVIAARLSNDIRNRLYATILLQDVAFFDGTSTGELTSRLSGNVDGAQRARFFFFFFFFLSLICTR